MESQDAKEDAGRTLGRSVRGVVIMMRANHLTAEEIIKYMDTSDLSEEYLLWMEEVSEHFLTCNECQRRLRQALIVESICEDGGLEAGLRLLTKEVKIRKKIDRETAERRRRKDKSSNKKKNPWQEDNYVWREPVFDMDINEDTACAQITGFSLSEERYKTKHYIFGISDVKRTAGAVRGADTENEAADLGVSAIRPITLELCGPNLIVRVAEEIVQKQIGAAGQRFCVVMEPTNREPLKAEAVWDEAGGCYVAEFVLATLPVRFQIYLEEINQ